MHTFSLMEGFAFAASTVRLPVDPSLQHTLDLSTKSLIA